MAVTVRKASAARQNKLTMILMGQSRAGKTHFCGTFPRPLFINPVPEGGARTLANESFVERYGDVMVIDVSTPNEIREAVNEIAGAVKSPSCKFDTVVFDSLTTITNMIFDEIAGEPTIRLKDNRSVYGNLGVWMRHFVLSANQWADVREVAHPVHVLWTATESTVTDPKTQKEVGYRPNVVGSTRESVPMLCQAFFRIVLGNLVRDTRTGKLHHERWIETLPTGESKIAAFGARFGDKLPPKFPATYQALAEAMGWPLERPSVEIPAVEIVDDGILSPTTTTLDGNGNEQAEVVTN